LWIYIDPETEDTFEILVTVTFNSIRPGTMTFRDLIVLSSPERGHMGSTVVIRLHYIDEYGGINRCLYNCMIIIMHLSMCVLRAGFLYENKGPLSA
jgi:hypothetical protein